VTHYRNGEAIPNVTDNSEWANLSSGAYCSYNNADSNIAIYGLLYNGFAIMDSKNIAPEGWHVPSDAEWQILVDYLGGDSLAGGKMKSTGTIQGGDGLWDSLNTGATNECGFSALPGGYRYGQSSFGHTGNFYDVGFYTYFRSSTEQYEYNYYYLLCRGLDYDNSVVRRFLGGKEAGSSVRCVRDSETTIIESSAPQPINRLNLSQNYPNPFNPSTTIEFTMPKSEYVELKIYNILGKEISTLVSRKLNQGNHTYIFDGRNLASGIYYYRIKAGNIIHTRKMIYLK
jgi:uncharacterized protein (TIGR02145 family)